MKRITRHELPGSRYVLVYFQSRYSCLLLDRYVIIVDQIHVPYYDCNLHTIVPLRMNESSLKVIGHNYRQDLWVIMSSSASARILRLLHSVTT